MNYITYLASVLFLKVILLLSHWSLVTYLILTYFIQKMKISASFYDTLFVFLRITTQHSHITYHETTKKYKNKQQCSLPHTGSINTCWWTAKLYPKRKEMTVTQWFFFRTYPRTFINSLIKFIEYLPWPGTGINRGKNSKQNKIFPCSHGATKISQIITQICKLQ